MTDPSSYAMFVETEVPEGELIISRTDLEGTITYANETFAAISGYRPEELVGRSHNILRHPDMPKSVFRQMWKTIRAGAPWEGYVKNMRKDRGYYWVYATVSGVYREGELVEYKSLRAFVPEAKRIAMQERYDAMRREEGDRIRLVAYVPAEVYRRLAGLAEAEGIGLDRIIARQLGRFPAE